MADQPKTPGRATPQLVSLYKSSGAPTPPRPVKTIRNDVTPLSRPAQKKPAFDHLRPWYPEITSKSAEEATKTIRPTPVVPAAPKIQPVRSQSVPPVRPWPELPARPQLQPTPAAVEQPKRPKRTPRRKPKLVKPIATGSAMLVGGLLLQAALYGEILIMLYAVFALVRRVESRTTFTLALISLCCILVMLLFRPNLLLMQNFAIYTFLLLLVGTVSLTKETRAS